MSDVTFLGITPYLYYDDLAAAIGWLERVFGFKCRSTYADEHGGLTNAELLVGEQELWLDGYPGYWAERGGGPDQWIGIWVDSADRMYERVVEAGVDCGRPGDRPHQVRELQVRDPQGFVWGFLERIG